MTFQNYVVAFLDLLGQRDALEKLRRLPTTVQEGQEFKQAAKQSVGKVRDFRKAFADFFDGLKRDRLDLTNWPAEWHEPFRALEQIKYTMWGISDSVVIAVPLSDNDEHWKDINGLLDTILSISESAAWALAGGIVFRGGLDVGVATLIEANEVYGPAVVSAIKLESEVAKHFRVVVGDDLLEYLEAVTNQDPKTKSGEMARHVAAFCRSMIVPDTDGQQMLDFLGTAVWAAMGVPLPRELVTMGHDFVEGEYKRFQAAGDEKLASRYLRLLEYYLARK
ncbi:MAG: hypothetical protein ABSG68_11345 [Thermoguttaceae bacterium]|jgi:hypothetical protein